MPLDEWPDELAVRLPRGRHRHVVRFIEHEGQYFAFKELPNELAHREYDTLLYLGDTGLPVVDLVGVAHNRSDDQGRPLESILVTRHLRYSLPYVHLFATPQPDDVHDRLINSLVLLLVQVHLAGVFWGDCSLGNALFRRDAGSLVAYLVDTETSERHGQLTDGQRRHDIMIAMDNIAGGLFELEAMDRLPAGISPAHVVDELEGRYHALWAELTSEEEIDSAQLWRIHQRLARLNDLGFDTIEIEYGAVGGSDNFLFRPMVVEEGHHRREIRRLIGIEAEENQARRLLSAIGAYTSWLSANEQTEVPNAVGAYRWLNERYLPTVAAIPEGSRQKLLEPELFIGILDHAGMMSERAGRDVDLLEAARVWNAQVLSELPPERLVLEVE